MVIRLVDTNARLAYDEWHRRYDLRRESNNLCEWRRTVTKSDTWYFSGDAGLWLGARTSSASYDFDGQMDDVGIYDKALSADEVKQLFAQRARILKQPVAGTPAAMAVYNSPISCGPVGGAATAVADAAALPGDVGSLGTLLGELGIGC